MKCWAKAGFRLPGSVKDFGVRVSWLGFRALSLGFRGLWFQGSGSRVQWFRVSDIGFW